VPRTGVESREHPSAVVASEIEHPLAANQLAVALDQRAVAIFEPFAPDVRRARGS